jgi:chitinase
LYRDGRFKEGVDFKEFPTNLAADSGWVKYWDENSKAPYAYNAGKQLFATYDDERSLAEKVQYAKKFRLGGIMFWELVCDRYSNGLLEAINKAK